MWGLHPMKSGSERLVIHESNMQPDLRIPLRRTIDVRIGLTVSQKAHEQLALGKKFSLRCAFLANALENGVESGV